MFLLDTEPIGILQWQTQPQLSRLLGRMRQHPQTAFWFSVVSFQEQVLGANNYISRARRPAGIIHGYRLLQKVLTMFAGAQVLPFDQAASDTFDQLRSQGVRIAAWSC